MSDAEEEGGGLDIGMLEVVLEKSERTRLRFGGVHCRVKSRINNTLFSDKPTE